MNAKIIPDVNGTDMVLLPREEYEAMQRAGRIAAAAVLSMSRAEWARLRERAAQLTDEDLEDAADTAAYDRATAQMDADGGVLPADLSRRITQGARLLTAIREWRGMTVDHVAQAAGLNPSQKRDFESGDLKPTPEVRGRLAQALDVPVSWLP